MVPRDRNSLHFYSASIEIHPSILYHLRAFAGCAEFVISNFTRVSYVYICKVCVYVCECACVCVCQVQSSAYFTWPISKDYTNPRDWINTHTHTNPKGGGYSRAIAGSVLVPFNYPRRRHSIYTRDCGHRIDYLSL